MGSFKTYHMCKYELNLIIPRSLLRGFHCHCEQSEAISLLRLLRRIAPRNDKKAVCLYDDALQLAAGLSISFFGFKTINSEIKSVLINMKSVIFRNDLGYEDS